MSAAGASVPVRPLPLRYSPAEVNSPDQLPSLPVAGQRRVRADALRNRERILCSAEQLFAERGVANVSMDEIAEHAEVGKGTLYRRFGDRGGLAFALLEAREVEFQESFLRGEPPLGPGAEARERLHAFFAALLAFLDVQLDLLLEFERGTPGARFRSGVYAAYHAHVALLLRELDPRLDAALLAHTLLAPCGAELLLHLRAQGVPREQILASLCRVIDGLAPAD